MVSKLIKERILNMKTCPKCNAQLPDDASFCNNCGEPLNGGVNLAKDTAATDTANNNTPVNTANMAAANTTDNTTTPSNGSFPFMGSAPVNNGAMPNNGAPVNNDAPMNNGIPAGNAAPQNPNPAFGAAPNAGTAKKKINPAIIGGIAVGAVVLIALIILIISSLGAYKKPIKNLVGLVNKRSTNVTAYLDCVAPPFVSSSYKSLLGTLKGGDAKKELDEAIKDKTDDLWDELEDQYGKGWKITIEWKDADKLSNKKLDDVKDRWEDLAKLLSKADLDDEDTYETIADWLDDEYNTDLNTKQCASILGKLADQMDDVKITAGYEVDLKLTISGKDGKDTDKITVYVIKVNGQWIIDPTSGAEGYDINDLTYMLNYM